MQDRPTLAELVIAVREFLETEIAPSLTDSRLKFRTLVAMNALSMITREADLEELLVREDYVRLVALLGRDVGVPAELFKLKQQVNEAMTDLAKRIRSGDMPLGTFEYLERAIRSTLEVSNPVYLKRYDV
jgi:hypothetical protein